MPEVRGDSAATCALLDAAARGEPRVVGALLERHAAELRRFVEARFDLRLRGRFDPADVVQDTQLEVIRRIGEFLTRRSMPFRLWVRRKALDRLSNLRRDHMTRARRAVGREQPLPDHSSMLVAAPLLARTTSPSHQAAAREDAARVSRAVARLSEVDREVLLLRHGDDLTFEEIGCLLNIEPAAARKRFGRALIRLQQVLRDEGLTGTCHE